MDYDWTAIIPVLTGGLVGGGFAVAGMVVTSRRERSRARREREEAAIVDVRRCLLGIEDLFSTHRDDDGDLTDAGERYYESLARELSAHIVAIRQPAFREPLETVVQVLQRYGIRQRYPDSDRQIARHGCGYGYEIVGSYLTGSKPPAQPQLITGYLEAQADQEAIWDQEDEERTAQRSGRLETHRRTDQPAADLPTTGVKPTGDPAHEGDR